MSKGKGFEARIYRLLGCVLTEEQPDAKDKQTGVNKTEFSPSKLCEKKKEN